MSRDRNCGPAAKKEAGVSYKSPRTFENKLCTCNLQQNDEFQISTYRSRQPNCLELPLKDGREKESGTFKSFKGDSELTSQTSDHDYYGVPSRLPESSEFQDFTELKLFPQVFQRICQKVGQSEIDVCFSVVQSAPGLLLMEVRPKQFGPRCIARNLVPQTPL